MVEKTTIQIDVELKDTLAEMASEKMESFNSIVKRLIKNQKPATTEDMKTATVDKYGKASISRTLAGRIIEWRVKE